MLHPESPFWMLHPGESLSLATLSFTYKSGEMDEAKK